MTTHGVSCELHPALFQPDNFKLMCFVDDPLAVIKGSSYERKLKAAVVILVWEALNFKLAYNKGQLHESVTWIWGPCPWVASRGTREDLQ